MVQKIKKKVEEIQNCVLCILYGQKEENLMRNETSGASHYFSVHYTLYESVVRLRVCLLNFICHIFFVSCLDWTKVTLPH